MTSVLRNRKKRMQPVQKEVGMIKEKKATVDHKGLCEGNLGLGLVSFLVFILFMYLSWCLGMAWNSLCSFNWPQTHEPPSYDSYAPPYQAPNRALIACVLRCSQRTVA